MRTKNCKACKVKKPLKDFTRNGPWFAARCKPCANEYTKKYNERKKKRLKDQWKWV